MVPGSVKWCIHPAEFADLQRLYPLSLYKTGEVFFVNPYLIQDLFKYIRRWIIEMIANAVRAQVLLPGSAESP